MASRPRIVVNPEPLKAVQSRPGGPVKPRPYLVCRKYGRAGVLRRLSVHRPGCPRLPQGWDVTETDYPGATALVNKADDSVPVGLWCQSCGGWSVSRL